MADPTNFSDKSWTDLVDNLKVFLSAATNLVHSLKQVIELSKLKSSQAVDVEHAEVRVDENVTKKEDCSDDLKADLQLRNSKKKLIETYSKEKSKKLATLKENLSMAQKNLMDIQEQVRQLGRLYQDYESKNTIDGQVNPAALYKEIMKPQSVPYISFNKRIIPRNVYQRSSVNGVSFSYQSKSYSKAAKNQYNEPQEKVSVLFAVPLNKNVY